MAMWDLAAKSNYYYQMDAQRDAEKRRSNPNPRTQQHQHQQHRSEHEIFCEQMGIMFPHGLSRAYTIRKKSYFHLRMKEFRSHSRQYWLVASTTTLFFLLQVIIGAIQTALGATRAPHISVAVFGAVATVIGGILAYLKSRGQPNRTRQLRNSLRKVVEEIEFQEIQLRNPEVKTTAKEAVDYINQLYEDARFQAETNYPDFWSTAGTKATKPGGDANLNANSNSAASYPGPIGHLTTVQNADGRHGRTPSATHRPPSYHPTPSQHPASQQMSSHPTSSHPSSNQHYPGPDLAADIPVEGERPLQVPNRVAHIPAMGGRYMNEKV